MCLKGNAADKADRVRYIVCFSDTLFCLYHSVLHNILLYALYDPHEGPLLCNCICRK